MKCPFCNKEIPEVDSICPFCGFQYKIGQNQLHKENQIRADSIKKILPNSRKNYAFLLFSLLFALIFVLSLILTQEVHSGYRGTWELKEAYSQHFGSFDSNLSSLLKSLNELDFEYVKTSFDIIYDKTLLFFYKNESFLNVAIGLSGFSSIVFILLFFIKKKRNVSANIPANSIEQSSKNDSAKRIRFFTSSLILLCIAGSIFLLVLKIVSLSDRTIELYKQNIEYAKISDFYFADVFKALFSADFSGVFLYTKSLFSCLSDSLAIIFLNNTGFLTGLAILCCCLSAILSVIYHMNSKASFDFQKSLSTNILINSIIWICIGAFQIICGFIYPWVTIIIGAINILIGIYLVNLSKLVLKDHIYIEKCKNIFFPILLLILNAVIGFIGIIGPIHYLINVKSFLSENSSTVSDSETK